MGKGSGCFPSKGSKFVGGGGSETPHERLEMGPSSDAKAAEVPAPTSTPPKAPTTIPPLAVENITPAPTSDYVEKTADDDQTRASTVTLVASGKVKVFIVYYSMYGHVLSLAKKVKEGVDSVEGVEGILYQVVETLPAEVLTKMSASAKDESIPTIKAAELPKANAFLFGFPTRYGMMAAQMKAFFDSTGSLWKAQSLVGKPAGVFISTGSQGGGQETTALTAITQLAHHGMLFVPIGCTFGAGMSNLDEPRGGSAYDAGTFAGNGTRMPSALELSMAEHQGRLTANVAKLLARK